MFSAALYARVQFSLHYSHTRSRVQRASGIPCALYLKRADDFEKLRAQSVARMRTHVSTRHPGCLKFESVATHSLANAPPAGNVTMQSVPAVLRISAHCEISASAHNANDKCIPDDYTSW